MYNGRSRLQALLKRPKNLLAYGMDFGFVCWYNAKSLSGILGLKMIVRNIKAMAATRIDLAVKDARRLADKWDVQINFTFNEILMSVTRATDISEAEAYYLEKREALK